ncbi:MAG: hypothetical protein IPJ03_17320 [Ignavibacteriales bacterium]|nr:hypothetical protein [Ignavibacteriales bacterium]
MNLLPPKIRPLDLVMITRKGNDSVGTNLLAYVYGRMYEEWITVISDFTADAGTDIITLITSAGATPDYSPELNLRVRFTTTTTLPAGLSTGTNYYVIPVSASTFKVSATVDGAAVNITDTGTGTHTAIRFNGALTANTTGGLISPITNQMESILRDEIFAERNLEITTKTSSTLIIATGLKSSVDDYYVGAIYHNVGTSIRAVILAYNGTTKEMTISTADTLSSVGNPIFITNIKGDAKIHKQSFQDPKVITGNKSINSFSNAYDLLNEMCFETFTILSTTQGKYKLSSLSGDGASLATWTNPLKDLETGDYLVQGGLTPLQNVYTEYVLNYQFNYARGDYDNSVSVSPTGYTDGFSLSAEQTLCLNAQNNYKLNNKWEYSSSWTIPASAEWFLQSIVAWFSKQRTWIRWGGDFGNYIKYEIGDIVLLNLSGYIPDSLNNSAKFLIYSKEVSFAKGSPQVIFELIEVE